MKSHGQDAYGRDITSEIRPDGNVRYHVMRDGKPVLFVEFSKETPMGRVMSTINAHADVAPPA